MSKHPKDDPARAAAGIYQHDDGRIYRVQVTKDGRRFAKVLVYKRYKDGPLKGKEYGQYETAKGAAFKLRKEHLLTDSEVRGFGRSRQVCLWCSGRLVQTHDRVRGIHAKCQEAYGAQ